MFTKYFAPLFLYILAAFLCFANLELFAQQSMLGKNVSAASSYCASERFAEIISEDGSFAALDSLYLFSLRITQRETGEALLTAAFVTLPYRTVPVHFSLLGISFEYPLISAPEDIYIKKNAVLKSIADSIKLQGRINGQDKFAHFFASAFLRYSVPLVDLTVLIGYFVEVFEESFTEGSRVDNEDLETNVLGSAFGEVLRESSITPGNDSNDTFEQKEILPSQFLRK